MSFGKTVLHGVSQSVPENADLPAAANMAAECLTEDLLGKWIYDIEQEEWLPMEYIPFRWDFATDEGFIGYHPLAAVPENTIVFDGFYSVLDRLISDGSPTIQIQLEAANDILADAAVGPAKATGAPGLHNIVPDGTAANAIKTTADRWIKLRVLTVRPAPLRPGRPRRPLRPAPRRARPRPPRAAAATPRRGPRRRP